MRFLVALIGNAILLLLWPLLALRRRTAAPRGAWLEVVVNGPVVEMARASPLFARYPQPLALQSLRRLVELARDDARVAGLLVRIQAYGSGSARATSLREILLEARRARKRVVAYLPNGGGTLALYIASAAEQVIVGPDTHLDCTGFAVEASYLRGLLDQVGVEPEVLARGRYKTAGEFLTSKSMSEPQREQIGRLLDVVKSQVVEALAEARGVDPSRVESWIDSAPWSARRAREAGVIDEVCWADELPKRLEPDRPDGALLMRASRYLGRRGRRMIPLFRAPRIAVIDVAGPIVSDAPFALLPFAAEKPVCRALAAAREDRRALGAIVNVTSRGGSALASARILRELRRLAEAKPTVAYLGDVAASGGYMIAVGAHAVVTQPSSVTGSIGVVAARLAAASLLRRLGVNIEVVKRGAHADMTNPQRTMSSEERALFEQQIDEIYASFVEAVAQGRKQSVEGIEQLAQGRVWSGRHAHEHGLVDRLGGFDVALEEVRKRIGPRSEGVAPVLIGPEHLRPPAPLSWILQSFARALHAEGLLELAQVAVDEPRAAAWLWSEIGGVSDLP